MALFLFVALGCATEPVEPDVELGAAAEGWRQLQDGEVVELHLGPQGGQHLAASARIDGLWQGERDDGTDDPRVGFRVTGEEGAVWSAALRAVRRPFVPCAAGGFELDGGATVFMVDGAEALDGRRAQLRVDVEDAFGATASDARWIEIRVVSDP